MPIDDPVRLNRLLQARSKAQVDVILASCRWSRRKIINGSPRKSGQGRGRPVDFIRYRLAATEAMVAGSSSPASR